jgi:hypothetical protein
LGGDIFFYATSAVVFPTNHKTHTHIYIYIYIIRCCSEASWLVRNVHKCQPFCFGKCGRVLLEKRRAREHRLSRFRCVEKPRAACDFTAHRLHVTRSTVNSTLEEKKKHAIIRRPEKKTRSITRRNARWRVCGRAVKVVPKA